jgi:hypothetical protein
MTYMITEHLTISIKGTATKYYVTTTECGLFKKKKTGGSRQAYSSPCLQDATVEHPAQNITQL